MNTMNDFLVKAIISFTILILPTNLYSQGKESFGSKLLIHIKTGYFIGANKWEFEHPIYSGTGGVSYETVDGISKGGMSYEGGLEWRKNKLGLKLAVGIKPSQIIVYQGPSISIEHTYNFNANYIEMDAYYYFETSNEKIKPFVHGGAGYIILTGDSKTKGVSINFGTGICWNPSDKINLYAGIDGKRIYYINYVESVIPNEVFDRTIHISPFIVHFGLSYRIK